MAKIILLLLAFALSTANAQKDITADFKDAKFLYNVRKLLKKCESEQIYDTDVVNFIELDLNEAGIENLAGIEYFKNLEVFNCSENLLTSLDVSKNTALRELYVSGNSLTSLDLSRNKRLLRIQCFSNLMPSKAAVKGFKGKWGIGDGNLFDPQRKEVLDSPKDLK